MLFIVRMKEELAARSPMRAAALCGIAVLFALKLVMEHAGGTSVFADSSGAGFVPVPLAHAAGVFAGLFVWKEDDARSRP